jgi:hypothetical protein
VLIERQLERCVCFEQDEVGKGWTNLRLRYKRRREGDQRRELMGEVAPWRGARVAYATIGAVIGVWCGETPRGRLAPTAEDWLQVAGVQAARHDGNRRSHQPERQHPRQPSEQ